MKFELANSDGTKVFTLQTDINGQVSSDKLDAGTYSLVEKEPFPVSGYEFASATCQKDNGDSVGTPIENGQGVEGIEILAHTEDIISCDFVNKEAPKLKIKKVVKNGVAGTAGIGDFGITLTNGPALDFALTGEDATTNTKTYEANPVVSSGIQYTLFETGTSGYEQESLTCLEGNNNLGSTFTLSQGKSAVCTIVNASKWSEIVVKKVTDPVSNPEDVKFTFTGNLSGSIGHGETITKAVLPGTTHTTIETTPPGWKLTKIECDSGASGSIVTGKSVYNDVGENKRITCTYTNTKLGSISGHKWNDADGSAGTTDDRTGVGNWRIFIDENGNREYDEGERFVLTNTEDEGDKGFYKFENLEPGTYVIVEDMDSLPGWYGLKEGQYHEITITPGQDKRS